MINFISVSRGILNSSLLTARFSLKYGKFMKRKNIFSSTESYLKLVNDERNAPSGDESDRCLTEIFNECQISDSCLKIEFIDKPAFGYSLTHKLVAIKLIDN